MTCVTLQNQCPQTSLTGDLQPLQLLHLVHVQFELNLKEVTWLSNVWWLLCFQLQEQQEADDSEGEGVKSAVYVPPKVAAVPYGMIHVTRAFDSRTLNPTVCSSDITPSTLIGWWSNKGIRDLKQNSWRRQNNIKTNYRREKVHVNMWNKADICTVLLSKETSTASFPRCLHNVTDISRTNVHHFVQVETWNQWNFSENRNIQCN